MYYSDVNVKADFCSHHVTFWDLVRLQTKFQLLRFLAKQFPAEHFIDTWEEKKCDVTLYQISVTLNITELMVVVVVVGSVHFPLNTAMSGLYFFNFSTRIFPPSRNSLLMGEKNNIECSILPKSEVEILRFFFLVLLFTSSHGYLERSLLPGVALDTILVKPILYLTGSVVSCMWLSCSSVNPDRNRHFPGKNQSVFRT